MTKAATKTVDFGCLGSENTSIPLISDFTLKGILIGVFYSSDLDLTAFPTCRIFFFLDFF